jgi:ribosome-associated protein
MNALNLARAALEKNAENVKVLDLSHVSSYADTFVICSGRSTRQVQAIADHLATTLRAEGVRPISLEGYGEGRWVLLDFGHIVVHVFLDELRDYYDLESLWSDAKRVPVPAQLLGPGASLA